MEQYMVVATKGVNVLVSPIIKDECKSCAAGCDKRAVTIEALNITLAKINVGDIVELSSSRKRRAKEGIFALLLPLACAIAGYLLASPFMSLFSKQAGEGTKALFVLVGFFGAAAAVYFASHIKHSGFKPYIKRIITSE